MAEEPNDIGAGIHGKGPDITAWPGKEGANNLRDFEQVVKTATDSIAKFAPLMADAVSNMEKLSGSAKAFAGKTEEAFDTVDKKLEEHAKKFRETVKEVSADLNRHIIAPMTEGGEKVMKSLGPIGGAVESLGSMISKIPFVGMAVGAITAFALINVASQLHKKEIESSLNRVNLVLNQYAGFMGTAKNVGQEALHDLAKNWGLGYAGAEKFLSLLATTGKSAIWESKESLAAFSREIMKMSIGAGVADTSVINWLSNMHSATAMGKGDLEGLTIPMREILALGKGTAIGAEQFSTALMKSSENFRVFGLEQRVVTENAKMLNVMLGGFKDTIPGGVGAATTVFQGLASVIGGMMKDPGMTLFLYGGEVSEGKTVFGKLAEIGRMKTESIHETYTRFVSKMRAAGAGEEAISMKFTMDIAQATGLAPAKVAAMLEKLDIIDKDLASGKISEEAGAKELKKVNEEMRLSMMSPMERIKVIMEDFMLKFLPAVIKVIIGLLTSVVAGLATLVNFAGGNWDVAKESAKNFVKGLGEVKEGGLKAGEGIGTAFKEVGKTLGVKDLGKDYAGLMDSLKLLVVPETLTGKAAAKAGMEAGAGVKVRTKSWGEVAGDVMGGIQAVRKIIQPGKVVFELEAADINRMMATEGQ